MNFKNRKSKSCRNPRCDKIFYANRKYKKYGFCSLKCEQVVMRNCEMHIEMWVKGVIYGDEIYKYVLGISSKSARELLHENI